MTVRIGLLYERIRKDEKLLLAELRERGHDVAKIDVRAQQFGIGAAPDALTDIDLVLDRCLAASRSRYAAQFCRSYGIPVVNSPRTAALCADKIKTSLALAMAEIPTPRTVVSFTVDAALQSIERMGYPCILKPPIGSWGRLMAKIDSRNAAEAILEHKATLGSYDHKVFYVQEFVDKPGRDIRVVAVDGEPVAAMSRSADHWLTNASRGAETAAFEIDDGLATLVGRASDAVGGGLLGVDLMETDVGYTVHEINHTVEFKALDEVSDIDVPAAVVDWLETETGPVVEVAA